MLGPSSRRKTRDLDLAIVKKGTNDTFLTRCVNGKGFRDPISVKEMSISNMSLLLLCTDGFYLSKDGMALKNGGQLPDTTQEPEDDASYIQIKML